MNKVAYNSISKVVTTAHVALYRATKGRLGGRTGLPVLLLTTTGRKSGRRRTKPLGYVKEGDDFLLAASNAGNDFFPSWWLNLKANPVAEIQVRGQRLSVNARKASPEEKERLWPKFLEAYKGYANYEKKTSREIPVVILTPQL
ncbi:MAG TPA: nitroreductase family deazaflavin-dependent oxidoreductase [Actinomycetota bacterium]|nr:nitroreductase family deazaflavin-dependent oxidoreductase [Actinomycetota bacterium]